ncbi:MAG: hypothetical protein R3F43_01145 [bacterium]
MNAPGLLTLAFEDDGQARVAAVLAQARALGVNGAGAGLRRSPQRPDGHPDGPGPVQRGGPGGPRSPRGGGGGGRQARPALVDDDAAYGASPSTWCWAGLPGRERTSASSSWRGQIREWFKAHARTIVERTNLTGNSSSMIPPSWPGRSSAGWMLPRSSVTPRATSSTTSMLT